MIPVAGLAAEGDIAYPNVAPDAPIYWPNVLMIPLGPAPYLKMLTVPGRDQPRARSRGRDGWEPSRWGDRTVDEANDDANSCSEVSEPTPGPTEILGVHTAAHHRTHLGCVMLARPVFGD